MLKKLKIPPSAPPKALEKDAHIFRADPHGVEKGGEFGCRHRLS